MFRRLILLAALLAPAAVLAQGVAVPYTLPNATQPDGRPRNVMPVYALPLGVVLTDCSATITTGGTSQQIAAANPTRAVLLVENPTAGTGNILVNFTAAASVGGTSIEIAPGGSLLLTGATAPSNAITATAADATHRIICKQG